MTSIYNSLTKDVPLDLAWREQVQQKTTEYFKSGRNKLEKISPDEWKTLKEAWRSFVQERCRTIFEYAGKPMEARIIKETKYDRFRVQKIVFETMPGWEIGLNLFLPLSDGPYLPVICPCGHSQKWNNDHQIPPQVLAVNGFAAALFDMPGCGERRYNNDHFIQGAQTAMVGIWSNHFFLIDAVRSADYLQTRGDIDFSRGMAVTGVSGGGFATAFMAVIDSRVKVSVPVCSIAPFGGSLIEGLYTGCPENFMKAQALMGLDFDHLIGLASPVPCLIIGGTGDLLFKPEQVKKSFAQAKRVYSLEGEADKLSLYLEDCGHSYTASMAHTAVRWIRRWLMNDDSRKGTGYADHIARGRSQLWNCRKNPRHVAIRAR